MLDRSGKKIILLSPLIKNQIFPEKPDVGILNSD